MMRPQGDDEASEEEPWAGTLSDEEGVVGFTSRRAQHKIVVCRHVRVAGRCLPIPSRAGPFHLLGDESTPTVMVSSEVHKRSSEAPCWTAVQIAFDSSCPISLISHDDR